MARKKRAKPETIPWDAIQHFPGLYPHGSEADNLLASKWQDYSNMRGIPYRSRLGQLGLVEKELFQFWEMALPARLASSIEGLAQKYDLATMAEIDWRLRFCRTVLTIKYPIDWTDSHYGEWAFDEDVKMSRELSNPLDDILSNLPLIHTREWFAAKILAHARRAEELAHLTGDQPALWREWMLLGETWAQAKTVLNLADDVGRGKKTIEAASAGGFARKGRQGPHTLGVLIAMQERISGEHSITNAARLAFTVDHLGTSPEANRKLWTRKK